MAFGRPTCIWRRAACDVLDRMNRDYRVLFTSFSATVITAAVLSGLAISVLPECALRPGMRVLGDADGFGAAARLQDRHHARPYQPAGAGRRAGPPHRRKPRQHLGAGGRGERPASTSRRWPRCAASGCGRARSCRAGNAAAQPEEFSRGRQACRMIAGRVETARPRGPDCSGFEPSSRAKGLRIAGRTPKAPVFGRKYKILPSHRHNLPSRFCSMAACGRLIGPRNGLGQPSGTRRPMGRSTVQVQRGELRVNGPFRLDATGWSPVGTLVGGEPGGVDKPRRGPSIAFAVSVIALVAARDGRHGAPLLPPKRTPRSPKHAVVAEQTVGVARSVSARSRPVVIASLSDMLPVDSESDATPNPAADRFAAGDVPGRSPTSTPPTRRIRAGRAPRDDLVPPPAVAASVAAVVPSADAAPDQPQQAGHTDVTRDRRDCAGRSVAAVRRRARTAGEPTTRRSPTTR